MVRSTHPYDGGICVIIVISFQMVSDDSYALWIKINPMNILKDNKFIQKWKILKFKNIFIDTIKNFKKKMLIFL